MIKIEPEESIERAVFWHCIKVIILALILLALLSETLRAQGVVGYFTQSNKDTALLSNLAPHQNYADVATAPYIAGDSEIAVFNILTNALHSGHIAIDELPSTLTDLNDI